MPQISNVVRVAFAFIAVVSVCAPASGQTVTGVAGLSWLAGCWSSDGKKAG